MNAGPEDLPTPADPLDELNGLVGDQLFDQALRTRARLVAAIARRDARRTAQLAPILAEAEAVNRWHAAPHAEMVLNGGAA